MAWATDELLTRLRDCLDNVLAGRPQKLCAVSEEQPVPYNAADERHGGHPPKKWTGPFSSIAECTVVRATMESLRVVFGEQDIKGVQKANDLIRPPRW